jgi:SAM-dependent methyltransferase
MERENGAYRDEMLAGLSGRVVEVGAGNGMNFAHYPAGVEAVVALEPEPYLRERARVAAAGAAVPVTVQDGVASPLPLADHSFDAAVASLVLCSVSDPARAIAELRRVLRPGGELRFFEHVRSSRPRKARVQRTLDRTGVWPALVGGCHTSRDTVAALEAAGFRLDRARRVDVGPAVNPANPHVVGAAVPR